MDEEAGTHVVGIAGSLRDGSYTRASVDHALRAAERTDATTELVDLREYDLPPFDADRDAAGDSEELTRRVRTADAVVLGTPMYHGSYAGVLKNALDYCGFDEFEDTTVGLLAVAGGSFPVTALEHLRSVCRALDAWVLPHQAAVPKAGDAIEAGEFVDADLEERVRTLGRRVVRYANIEPDPRTPEASENVGASD
ncbi:MAG: NADPH-dependent FMN reductase [Haloferacaceae archaeon]